MLVGCLTCVPILTQPESWAQYKVKCGLTKAFILFQSSPSPKAGRNNRVYTIRSISFLSSNPHPARKLGAMTPNLDFVDH